MFKKITPFFFSISLFAILATVLVTILFWGMPSDFFYYIHDEYLAFPGPDLAYEFSIRALLDLGTSNTFQVIVTFFDRVYFQFIYLFGVSVKVAQIYLIWLKFFVILTLPYVGFKKLAMIFKVDDAKSIFVVTLWYAFNTFTVIFWHGNGFSLTLLICYSLAPLAFYYWENLLFSQNKAKDVKQLSQTLVLAVVMFFMSFALYFFAPFFLMMISYTVLKLLVTREGVVQSFRRLALLAITCVPLFIIHVIVIYEMFFLSVGAANATGNETYGNLSGGLLYMELMWFAWPIYTIWTPRNIWTFSEYYMSFLTMAAPLVLYFQIIWAGVKKTRTSQFVILMITLIGCLFLAKGAQEPFGDVFVFLINNVPGFRVFRSPDSKFGFAAVFLIAVLCMIISNSLARKVFVSTVLVVTVLQAYPLFTGLAIKGENSSTSRDRIVTFPEDYHEVANYLNSEGKEFGYVMTFPSLAFAAYSLGKGEQHAGQDLLPKLVLFPFAYTADDTGIAKASFDRIQRIIRTNDFKELRNFGVRYYVVRSDVRADVSVAEFFLKGTYRMVVRNKTFRVYEDEEAFKFVKADSAIVTNLINYPLVDLSFNEVPREIMLFESYHSSWKLYPKYDNELNSGIISYFFKKPLVSAVHGPDRYNMNRWRLFPNKAKKLTGVTLVYWPQILFYILSLISAASLVMYGIFLLKNRKKI